MALQLSRDLQVWWPVLVSEPADGGAVTEFPIELHLAVPRPSAVRALVKAADTSTTQALAAEDKWIARHVIGWRGVHDEQGNELKYSPDNLALLLDHPGGRQAVVGALFATAGAREAVVKKTLPTSPAGGPVDQRKLN